MCLWKWLIYNSKQDFAYHQSCLFFADTKCISNQVEIVFEVVPEKDWTVFYFNVDSFMNVVKAFLLYKSD